MAEMTGLWKTLTPEQKKRALEYKGPEIIGEKMEPRKLKSWSHFFKAIKAGEKTHDLRSEDDGKFFVGQILTLEEYDFVKGTYTGDTVNVIVTYITSRDTPCAFSSSVLEPGYCILSIKVTPTGDSWRDWP